MPAEPVTLLLPTVNRPAFLRTALASIAAQSAVSRLTRVVVSENSGHDFSRSVVQEFSRHLPIEYVLRQPALSAFEHGRVLYGDAPTQGLIAILHDDDWWGPHHLADSIARLTACPEAAASYASFCEVTGESSLIKADSSLMFWFGAGYPKLTADWILDQASVLFSCLSGTPGRYSTLVARAPAFREAVQTTFQRANPYDNDRYLLIELARLGKIVFGPLPAVFIRTHPQQDSHNFAYSEQDRHMGHTTRQLLTELAGLCPKLSIELDRRIAACPAPARPALIALLGQYFCAQVLVERAIAPPALVAYHHRQIAPPNWRYRLGRWLPPPLLVALARRKDSTENP